MLCYQYEPFKYGENVPYLTGGSTSGHLHTTQILTSVIEKRYLLLNCKLLTLSLYVPVNTNFMFYYYCSCQPMKMCFVFRSYIFVMSIG